MNYETEAKFTDSEILIAARLSNEWQSRSKIRCQVDQEDCFGISRVHLKKLTRLGIAETRLGRWREIEVRSGPLADAFNAAYAARVAKLRRDHREARKTIEELFGTGQRSTATGATGRFSSQAYRVTGPIRLFPTKPTLTLVAPHPDRG